MFSEVLVDNCILRRFEVLVANMVDGRVAEVQPHGQVHNFPAEEVAIRMDILWVGQVDGYIVKVSAMWFD